METQLLTELIRHLPQAFVRTLMQKIEWAYREAYGAVGNDPLVDQPERDYLYPHYRRSILEKSIRDLAQSLGLDSRVCENAAGNHQFTEILAGRFVITCSHSTGPDWMMLRSSHFRRQNAELNALLAQFQFDKGGFEVFNPKDNGGLLNAVIYHATDREDSSQVGYLRLGFPSPDYSRWASKFEFDEILGAYPRIIETKEEDEKLIIKWKMKRLKSNYGREE